MERKICKRCGKAFYFDSEFCLDCKNLMIIEDYEKMTDEEILKLYNQFNKNLNNQGYLSEENEKKLEMLLTANDKVDSNFQMNCIDKGYFEIPELFYNASKQVHNKLIEACKGLNPLDEKVRKIFDSLAYSFGFNYDENGNQVAKLKTCKELLCIQNDIKEDTDIYSCITLKIIDENKIIEIKDALNCLYNEEELPYEYIGTDRIDNGKSLVYRADKEVSVFRSTFNNNYNTIGGFINKYIDLSDVKCCDCSEKFSPIAQINCENFNCEGTLVILKCLKCDKYIVNYFNS